MVGLVSDIGKDILMDYSHRLYDPPMVPIIDSEGQIMIVAVDELAAEDTILHPATTDYELAFEVTKAWRFVAANANDYFLRKLDKATFGVILHRIDLANQIIPVG